MDFKKSFCSRSNLSNNLIISAYARSENGFGFQRPWVWKMTIYLSEIGSGFGEPGGTQRIPGGGTEEKIRILPTAVEYSRYVFMCFTLQCTAVLYCFAPIYVRITLV